jgi:hypothetical protein
MPGSSSILTALIFIIRGDSLVTAKKVAFGRREKRFTHSDSILSVATEPVQMTILQTFEFSSPAGDLVLSLAGTATIADARSEIANRLSTRGGLAQFWFDRRMVLDVLRLLAEFRGGHLSVVVLTPIVFVYENREYPIPLDPTQPVSEVAKAVAQVIGGGFPAESLQIYSEASELDGSMCITDLGVNAPRLTVVARRPSVPASSHPLPVLESTSVYRIGMISGVVPQFSRFTLSDEAWLSDIKSEVTSKWNLTVPTAFALVDSSTGDIHPQSDTVKLRDIDHNQYEFIIRPADSAHTQDDPGPAQLIAAIHGTVPRSIVPAAEGEVRLRFKVPQRGDDCEIRINFSRTNTVREARKRVAEHLGTTDQTLMLKFAGAYLRDAQLLDRLRTGDGEGDAIEVYIRDTTKIMLVSVRGWK